MKKDLQLSAVFVVTVFFQGKRSRRDLKFHGRADPFRGQACLSEAQARDKVPLELAIHPAENMGQTDWSFSDQALRQHGILRECRRAEGIERILSSAGGAPQFLEGFPPS